MTALNEFDRLECTGIWRAEPDTQRRDVIVSVGDATLIISDQKDTALAHWSLPAVERANPGEHPALFGPGPDSQEVLEIDDELMIKAITKVHTAIARRKPHPGRLRYFLAAGASLVIAALLVFWLPEAMIKHTASVVPPAARLVIGHDLLTNIQRIAGGPCETENGNRALSKMHVRLLGDQPGQIVILAGGVNKSEHLPGGLILLNRALVEDFETPDVSAGFILEEDLRAKTTDPLVRMLEQGGLISVFRLLTTGKVEKETQRAYSEYLLTSDKPHLDETALLDRFRMASVQSSPYAYALDISGETTIGLIEADPALGGPAIPVLTDDDWVGLQQVCGE